MAGPSEGGGEEVEGLQLKTHTHTTTHIRIEEKSKYLSELPSIQPSTISLTISFNLTTASYSPDF